MDFMKQSIEALCHSEENRSKLAEAIRQLKEDVDNGKIIMNPTTDEERHRWEMERAYWERDRYNSEDGAENEVDGYNCDECKNKGMIAEVIEEDGHYRCIYNNCKCRAIRTFIRKAKASGLKDVMKKYTFSKYETTEDWQTILKDKAMRFASDDEHSWFFIGGQSGCGKSHLCTAICTHYLKQGKNVKYMMWRDDSNYVKSVINDSEEYQKAINSYKKVDVLYIDDLFKMGKNQLGEVPRPTTADINLAFEVLNYRYNNKDLITIISSERRISDLMDIDSAVGGRIAEMTTDYGYALDIRDDVTKNYRIKGIVEL